MLSIGDFARHAQVSVRMLRHYDSLGLLVPAQVDEHSGYRHYSASQLPRANRLVALKELGFTLDQVRQILTDDLGPEELRGMLRVRQADLARRIEADSARLASVAHRLRSIESEGCMSELEYVEKSVPAVRLAQLSDWVDDVTEIGPRIGPMFASLAQTLPSAGVSIDRPSVAWYKADGDRTRIAAGWPTHLETISVPDVEIEDLPEAPRALTVIHRGSMDTIDVTWQSLVRQAEASGLELTGRCREVYLETPMDAPEDWVTELQQPVK